MTTTTLPTDFDAQLALLDRLAEDPTKGFTALRATAETRTARSILGPAVDLDADPDALRRFLTV